MAYTDEHPSYSTIGQKYTHHRIKHSERCASLATFTPRPSRASGRWSKRGMGGVYDSVSAKWLQSYLDEYAWRHSHREFPTRQPGLRRMATDEVMFCPLVARAATTTL